MHHELTEETLEEGRIALYRLERQLKEQHRAETDSRSEGSSQRLSTLSGRRLLDQLPRATRLNNRSESLGLTIEELDDRGLLDGGGSVPSYYTSMKQKNRRVLELQPRSHRLQERGKESFSKLANALFHMLRTLSKKGLDLEQYLRGLDSEQRLLLHRKQLLSTLRRLGLPFSLKELTEVVQHYVQQSANTDVVDYVKFLKDARLLSSASAANNNNNNGNNNAANKKYSPTAAAKNNSNNTANNNNTNNGCSSKTFHAIDAALDTHTRTLHEVKRMLLASLHSLGRRPDEIYRQFARWDTQGTGTVTATQFLRVLARLHIDLCDADQDFLVELLDTSGAGRIDFEALLAFCFSSDNTHSNVQTQAYANNQTQGHASGLSLSHSLSQSLSPTPHTDAETHTNPHKDRDRERMLVFDDTAGETLSAVSLENTSVGSHSQVLSHTQTHGKRPQTALSRPYGGGESRALLGLSSSLVLPSPTPLHQRNRPLTASARVGASASVNNASVGSAGTDRERDREREKDRNNNKRSQSPSHHRGGEMANAAQDELMLVEELPDDVINGEERFLSHTQHTQHPHTVDEDEDAIPSALGLLNDRLPQGQRGFSVNDVLSDTKHDTVYEPSSPLEPADHLVLLANQILATLRDIVLARYRRGRSLADLYDHFDQERKGFFNARDLRRTTADLRIETSERVAKIAIRQLAIDGGDRVSFGEFKVFVLDADHALLALNVQEQLAALLERQGREFNQLLESVFYWEEEALASDSRSLAPSQQSSSHKEKERERERAAQGFVSKTAFEHGLRRIGLALTAAEIARLVDRFDVHGNEQCSAPRFLQMVRRSDAWKHAEHVLRLQDQAVEEAALLRKQRAANNNNVSPELTDELISMCEYLGIRVLSEKDMIWIAADALKAPLPVNWTAERDAQGRTFFFNHLTQQSRWEHPLDPHFRNLRDKYRQSAVSERPIGYPAMGTADDGLRPRSMVLPANKPPQLDAQFPAQPLPSTRAQTAVPSASLAKKTRPQSATPEVTLYHRPASSVPQNNINNNTNNNNNSSGMAKSSQGRPLSAPQHVMSTAPSAQPQQMQAQTNTQPQSNPQSYPPTQAQAQTKSTSVAQQSPAGLLNALLSGTDTGIALQSKTQYNYYSPAASAQFVKDKQSAQFVPRSNKDFVAQTRAHIEQVYATPMTAVLRPSTASKTRAKSASHTRPTSANNNSNGNTNSSSNAGTGRSAVDRALAIGKTSQLATIERERETKSRRDADQRQQKLQEMLEGNILEKLDHAIVGGNSRRSAFA